MTPFFTGTGKDGKNGSANTAELINCRPETVKVGGRYRYAIWPVAGLEAFADLGTPLLREMQTVNGVIYAVANGQLYGVGQSGGIATLGTVKDDEFTTISGNGPDVVVTSGGVYQVWNGASVLTPTGYLGAVQSAAFHEYYTILTGPADYWEWTALADATTRDALQFARNEASNDKTLRAMADGRELWFFGETSIEVWAGSNQSGVNAYTTRVTAIERGVKSRRLICKPDTGFFFIGNDGVPYITQGLQVVPVFHPGVVSDIGDGTADRCFYYEDRGHKLCVIRFTDRPAWELDLSMGEWSRRSTGVNEGPWEVVATAFAYGNWYCATNGGKVYRMAHTAADDDRPLKRTMRTQPIYMDGERGRVVKLELLGEYGKPGLARDAVVMLRVSRDNGKTWSDPIEKNIGGAAEYGQLSRWRNLGQSRSFVFEFSMTDPLDVAFGSEGVMKIA